MTRLNSETLALKQANKIFKSELDTIQQHGPPPNLRIYNVKVQENETSANVDKVGYHGKMLLLYCSMKFLLLKRSEYLFNK